VSSPDEFDLSAAAGWVDPDVAAEFPGLRLDWLSVDGGDGNSPPELIARLRNLSNRVTGASVVAMRTKPIPHAYRAFFRHIGLDPDVTRIPSEQAAVARLFDGRFRPRSLVPDALLIAVVETGVPVYALDAALVDAGGPGIRVARAGERLGEDEYADFLEPGTLIVADSGAVHGVLFGEPARAHAPSIGTERMILFAVSVAGIPAIHVEEALWLAVEGVRTGHSRPA
jgi:DNA/RNA-binding domain of Phe-tRNA-synthetase-like protein